MSEYVIAPVEPDDGMMRAGIKRIGVAFDDAPYIENLDEVYEAMLAAFKAPEDLVIVRLDEAAVERVMNVFRNELPKQEDAIPEPSLRYMVYSYYKTGGLPHSLAERYAEELVRDNARAAIAALKEGA